MNKIEEAKQVLREAGYNVDNLYNVEDLMFSYHCTKEEATVLLQNTLSSECTTNNFTEVVSILADMDGIETKV